MTFGQEKTYMMEMIEKSVISRFSWKNSKEYYLNLSAGILSSVYLWDTGWIMPLLVVTTICAIGFMFHIMEPWIDSRLGALLARFGYIPLDFFALVYLIRYDGLYNNPWFVGFVLLVCAVGTICWLWYGNNPAIRIFVVYLLAMMAFWVALRFIELPSEQLAAVLYYGSILVAVVWMIIIHGKVFASYNGYNFSLFLLLWFGVMLLDVVSFQLIPYVTEGTPMFTTIPWA